MKPKKTIGKLKKEKVLTCSQWQKKCDALLSPIIIQKHPRCLLCNGQTQVAHHHVHKSKSSILRYDFDNLINLCNSCHFALHQNESYYASRIVQIKGLKWFEGLQRKKDKILKVTVAWYEAKLEELKELSTG